MKRIAWMGALLCLLVMGLGMARPAAAADPAFAQYREAVQSLDMGKMADMQLAARAFAAYARQVLSEGNKAALAAHLDDTLLVNGKKTTAKAVRGKLDRVINDTVVADVTGMSQEDDILIRNMTDCMLGVGSVWFVFKDDDAGKPVIVAVNNQF